MIDDIEELPNSVVLLLKDNTQANQVIVKPGHITDYLITGIPGTIEQEVTTEEIAQGSITVNNLEANTKYSVQLMNGEVTCGYITITTTSDDVIVIYPGDDIKEIIENAPDSSNFLISQGTYHASSEIIINKSVSIKGISRQNFPNLHVSFQIYDEGDLDHKIDFALENLNLLAEKESGSAWDYIARLRTAEKEYGKMTFVNVFGTGYMKSIFSGQGVAKPLVDLLSFENCIFKDVISSGADCIDFRDGGTIKEVVLSKSSFINCATARDFLRLDDAASAYPTQATSINIDRCTFVGVSNSASRRMLYVRNQSTLSFTHNIVASTAGYFNNSANLVAEKFLNNNYFEADLFITDLSSEDKDAGKYRLIDNSDSFTLHDPMFKNPESGDYTVSNSNLNEIGSGETRW